MGKLIDLDHRILESAQRLFIEHSSGTLAESKKLLIGLVLYTLVVLHIVFFVFFSYQAIYTMAAFNALAVFYAVAQVLAFKRRCLSIDTLLLLLIAEVCLHAAVATFAVGWLSGFAIYTLTVSPMIISFSGKRASHFIIAILTVLFTLSLTDLFFFDWEPIYVIEESTLNWLRRANYLFALIFLCSGSMLYHLLLGHVHNTLRKMAEEDLLTGLNNRRAFEQYANETITTCVQWRASVCVALGDIDRFKRVNDIYGHAIGDAVLLSTAKILSEQCRVGDHVARWGGEEFAWIFPNTSLNEAHVALERLRQTVEEQTIQANGENLRVTISIGLVEVQPGESLNNALERADSALYLCKSGGRNQVNVENTQVVVDKESLRASRG